MGVLALLLLAGQALRIEKAAAIACPAPAAIAVEGRILAVASGEDVRLFTLPEGKPLRTLKDIGGAIDLAGGVLLAGTAKPETFRVRLIDPVTGKTLRTLERPVPLAAHAFRGVIATAGHRGLRLHGLERLNDVAFWQRKDLANDVQVFPFGRDGTLAARVRPGRGSELQAANYLAVWGHPWHGSPRLWPVEGKFVSCGLAPRGDQAALGMVGTNRVQVIDLRTGARLHELAAHAGKGDILAAAYSPCGRWLLAVSGENTLGVSEAVVWRVPDYREAARADLHRGGCRSARWLPDGSGFVTAGETAGEVAVWRLVRPVYLTP